MTKGIAAPKPDGSRRQSQTKTRFWSTFLKEFYKENQQRPNWTRRRMARERRGAGSSVFSIETLYYKAIYYRCIIGRWEPSYTQTPLHIDVLHADTFTRIGFYTQTPLHTETFTQTLLHANTFTYRRFYTQTLLHTDAFTHRHFYTQTLLHANTFTYRRFYTQTLLPTDAFTHRRFHTQKLLHTETFTHRRFYTQKLLHTDAFTHRRFYTQTLLHTNTFTHRGFYTQNLSHTEAFTHKHFHTQRPDPWNRNFTSVFGDRTSFRAKGFAGTFANRNFSAVFGDRTSFGVKGLRSDPWNRNFTAVFGDRTSRDKVRRHVCKSQFYHRFWRSNLISFERVAPGPEKSQFYLSFCLSNLISCERVAPDALQIAILQFLAIEPHFVQKCCTRTSANQNRNFTSVFGDRTSFRGKRLRRAARNRNFTSAFSDRTSFCAKGLRPDPRNRNFTSVFGDRTSFRAKGLCFVPSRWHCPAPSREKKKGESKRAREQEGKRECEDVKMRRCEDEKMRRCDDVKMKRARENVKMRRWEDEQMWRWEDVKMRRCEDCKMLCEDVNMWKYLTDPHYLNNPSLRRSREKSADKSADKSLSQPWCSHSNTIYKIQLQKTITLRMQPRNLDAATTMWSADTELRNTIELRATASEIAAPKPDGSRRQSEKKTILKHFLKELLKGKLLAPKFRKSADKSLLQPGYTIYEIQLQKTIVLRMQPRHQATLTQPLHCISQHHVANMHVSTHTATPGDNNHADIPMRSATTHSRHA